MAALEEITGKALSGEWGTDDESGTGIPVLRTTNFTNEGIVNYNNVVTRTITKKNIQDKYLRKGDIIIEKSGGSDSQPVGRVIYYDGPEERYLFNNFTGLLRVQNLEIWNPKYVFYSLFANYKRGGTRAFENKTTGLHNLKIDDFVRRTDIPEIELSTQNNICEILDSAYQIIVNRRKQLDQLDTLIKARFVEMFEQGNDWDCCELSQCCINPDNIKCGPFGSQLHAEDYISNGIPVYGIPEVNSGFKTSPRLFISESKAESLSAYSLQAGDIAVSRKGNVGQAAFFNADQQAGIIHSDVLRIRVDVKKIDPVYLIGALHNSPRVKHQITMVSSGAVMPGTNVTKLKKIVVNVPPIELQRKYGSFVYQVDKSKAAVQKSLDETQLLMDSLMQQYFG